MTKKLIEIGALALIVIALIYMFNSMGPLGTDVKIALKYIWWGIIAIIALTIIAGTLLGLVTIIFGVSWLKGLTCSNTSGNASYGNIGNIVSKTVKDAISGAFGSIKELKDLSPRSIDISIEKYPYDSFKVKNISGDIKISAHDGENISGKIVILEKEENDAEVYFENGEVRIKTKSGKKASLGDVELHIPNKLSSLSIESQNGDISITGFKTSSDSSFKGINGDISISDFSNSKEIFVKTINGDIRIKNSQFNSILTQSVSGDIIFRESSAENAIFKTVNGDVDYRESSIKNPSIKTVSGEIRSDH